MEVKTILRVNLTLRVLIEVCLKVGLSLKWSSETSILLESSPFPFLVMLGPPQSFTTTLKAEDPHRILERCLITATSNLVTR